MLIKKCFKYFIVIFQFNKKEIRLNSTFILFLHTALQETKINKILSYRE